MRDTVLGQGWGKYLEHLFGVLNEWVPGCPWVPINQPLGSYWHLLGGAGRCVFFFQPFVSKDCINRFLPTKNRPKNILQRQFVATKNKEKEMVRWLKDVRRKPGNPSPHQTFHDH